MHETIIATGLEFPEGPVCTPDGAVYIVEIRGGRVQKIAPDGTLSVFARPNVAFGGANGSTLFTTESSLGRVVVREWPRRGLALW